jgi:NADH:ubiquinone oxidoreductase subunit C
LSIENLPLKRLSETAEYLRILSSDLEEFERNALSLHNIKDISQKHVRLVELTDENTRNFKKVLAPLSHQFCRLAEIFIVKYIEAKKKIKKLFRKIYNLYSEQLLERLLLPVLKMKKRAFHSSFPS